jgi:hypothetical protein
MNEKDLTPEDMTPIERLKEGRAMLGSLLEDMEDESFWTDPPGVWEAKQAQKASGYDEDGNEIE